MLKLVKLLGILSVVSLLALPLVGCGGLPWESGMTLTLKVDSPKNGITVNTPTVTVSGHVLGSQSGEAVVIVNGENVSLTDKNFSIEVKLTEGKNVITVVGKAGAAELTETVNVIYTPAK